MRAAFTRRVPAGGALVLLTLGFGSAAVAAQAQSTAGSGTWLDSAAAQKRCPASPVNVPAALLQATSAQDLRSWVSVVGDTLWVTGSSNPNHIVITAGSAPDTVGVSFDGQQLGPFGPVARVHVLGGDGGDVMIVDADVSLPAILEAGAGASCLQGGSGADQLIGGAGDDVLIAGTGRPALNAGPGRNQVVVPQHMGTLWVTPAADVSLMQRLSTLYTLQSPPNGSGALQGPLSPVIVGPPDLQDAGMISLMRQVYAAGEAVAVTDAAASDVAALRALLGHPNAAEDLASGERAEMVVFRKAQRPGTQAYDNKVTVFGHPADNGALLGAPRSVGEYTSELLSQAFSAAAIVPQPPNLAAAQVGASGGSAENDLLQVADSYTSSKIAYDAASDQVQIVNSIWSVRSFSNKADFYYVLQEIDSRDNQGLFGGNVTTSQINSLSAPATLIQTSPGNTQCSVSTTSGVSFSIGGSTGWNQMQGLNASLTGGVTISNSKTITCPQIMIVNGSNPGEGSTSWEYTFNGDHYVEGTLLSFYNQWIWEVPFSSYSATQKAQQEISIGAKSQALFLHVPFPPLPVDVQLTSVVPIPFGDNFTLQAPEVASVSPTCVNAGNKFTINGTGFYPSLVTGVLIGGSPLTQQQYTVMNNTSIDVVAPGISGDTLPVVVQSTLGLSNTSVTINISTGSCGVVLGDARSG